MLCLTLSPFFPDTRPNSMSNVGSRVSNRVRMSKKNKIKNTSGLTLWLTLWRLNFVVIRKIKEETEKYQESLTMQMIL